MGVADGGAKKASSSSIQIYADLQVRANALFSEFRSYQTHLELQRKQHVVEVKTFKRGVSSEVKTLQQLRHAFEPTLAHVDNKVAAQDGEEDDSSQLHALKSSNLPFYEVVWDVAKSCSSITSLGKKMYLARKNSHHLGMSSNGYSASPTNKGDLRSKKVVVVDIVADDGLRWIKVSTLTEKRLLFEMAKEGWEKYGDCSDESDANSGRGAGQNVGDRAGKLELVRLAEDLQVAAQGVRVRFRHPFVQFILPKIREGVNEDVDAFLADLRATGASVQCGDYISQSLGHGQLDLDRLLPSAGNDRLTPTINVDCTFLLALISDISHLARDRLMLDSTSTAQTYHKAIISQIEAEKSTPMLAGETYPLFAGRVLECTSHAAQRMREIVQCMGTPSERRRADILLGESQYKGQASSSLRQAFGRESIHAVPNDLRLPVKVVDFEAQELTWTGFSTGTPHGQPLGAFSASIAVHARDILNLSHINASVFLYGWSCQITTFTSNRVVAAGLVKTINDLLDLEELQGNATAAEFIGPLIYTCETARSLIGKAKFK